MISAETYDQYFTNLLRGHKGHCIETVESLLSYDTGVREIYEHLFRRSLYQVGEYWEHNKISVATEHMATAITESLMIQMQASIFATDRTGKKALIACLANEHHQVGAKMIADIFEMHGWDGYFIGANTPVKELLRFVEEKQPDVIGLSLSIYFNMNVLLETLRHIRKLLPDIPVVVGGQAFRWGGKEVVTEFEKVHFMDTLDTLESYIARHNSITD
jgi:MerR family transcriptional regulator, light-induced transcriptional regulator